MVPDGPGQRQALRGPAPLGWPGQAGRGIPALGRLGWDSPLVWPLNWGPTVMYSWNTGHSWITSSSPKVVTIWRWVDVCLKTVMFPEGTGASAGGLLWDPAH